MKTTYDITLDKTQEGTFLCHVMRPPIRMHTFTAEPEGSEYRLYEFTSQKERIDLGLVANERLARANLTSMAQAYILNCTKSGRR